MGTTLSVIFADHYSPLYTADHIIDLYSNPYFVTYMIIIPIFALLHYGMLKYVQHYNLSDDSHPNHSRWQTLECIGYAGTAGILGSQAILFAKQFMELLKANASLGDNIWIRWQLYFIVLAIPIFLGCNITFLNAGLRHYSALQTVPIYQTYWMIIGTISGLIFFKEIDEMSNTAQAFFWIGILTSVIGIVILSGRAPERIMTAQEKKHAATTKRRFSSSSSGGGTTPPGSPPLMGNVGVVGEGRDEEGAGDGGSAGGTFRLNDHVGSGTNENDTDRMLGPNDETYGAVAFSDFLDASALKSVGDIMVESGYMPTNSVMRDVFIRPPQVGSGSFTSSTGSHSNSGSPKTSPQMQAFAGPAVTPLDPALGKMGSSGELERGQPRRSTLGERNARVMAEKGMDSPRRSSMRRRGKSEDDGVEIGVDQIPIAVSL